MSIEIDRNKLRYCRERVSLSQAEAARRLHVSPTSVCLWESGKFLPGRKPVNPSYTHLLALAHLYQCSPEDLVLDVKKFEEERLKFSNIGYERSKKSYDMNEDTVILADANEKIFALKQSITMLYSQVYQAFSMLKNQIDSLDRSIRG